MASREKKPSTGKKQQTDASLMPHKETPLGTTTTQAQSVKIIKKRVMNPTRKGKNAVAKNKVIALSLKAKDKQPQLAKKIVKVILTKEIKKNGIAFPPKKIIKKKPEATAAPTEPVPSEKKTKKPISSTPKPKTDNTNSLSKIDDTINSILKQIGEDEQAAEIVKIKRPRVRKLKMQTSTSKPSEIGPIISRDTVSETIEEVMKDLSSLIKNEEITKKVVAKKPKEKKGKLPVTLDENIHIDASAKHLIDMLDLCVTKNQELNTSPEICIRRHSIEKLSDSRDTALFSNVPRSNVTKHNRTSKVRTSLDSVKRFSPYNTRSDAPTKKLRNGKPRKMKENLLEGVVDVKRRRKRLGSEFSCSEKSKLSGYESDSSFSDIASNLDSKKDSIKVPLSNGIDDNKSESLTDDNSNLCTNFNESTEFSDPSSINNMCSKVPEKAYLLGIMKQAFNDINQDQETSELVRQTIVVSTGQFYGHNVKSESIVCEPEMKSFSVPFKEEIIDSKDDVDVQSPKASAQFVMDEAILQSKVDEIIKSMEEEDFSETVTSHITEIEKSDFMETVKGDDSETVEGDDSETVEGDFYETVNGDVTVTVNSYVTETVKSDVPQTLKIDITETLKFNITDSLKSDLSETIKSDITETVKSDVTETVKSDFTEAVKSDVAEEEYVPVVPESEEVVKPTNAILNEQNDSIQNTDHITNDFQPVENADAKENILQALGLQSLKAVEEAKLKEKLFKSDYTGSLKTVIKINRIDKHKRHILKMSACKYEVGMQDPMAKLKESASSINWKTQNPSAQSSDTAGAPRKSHNSNRINMDGSSEHTSDGDTAITEDDAYRVLVIPEKASSFSVHPGRLCKDECTYCFGKFGLFDTPCHIAQMKSVERQDKILETERHLTRDSCLCDACYRHVDRKSNTPSYLNKGSKRNSIIAPGPRQNHCHVLSCANLATHILRRKWVIKMRKSVSKLINIDLDNPGLHSIPICDAHYLAVEHLMICAMCKRRLTRNQIHYLGTETNDLNTAFDGAGIPIKLFDKPVVCKLCRYFASLILRPVEDRPDNTNNFFREYRRRLLHFHNIDVMDDVEEIEEPPMASKDKLEKDSPAKKKKKLHHKHTNNIGPPVLEPQVRLDRLEHSHSAPLSDSNSTGKSRSESPSDYMVDYNTLIPSIAMECGSDPETSKKAQALVNNNSVQLGSNSCISVRELFPGEEDLGLQCHIDFTNIKEKTPEGWEKCSSIIQYDPDTKLLWQELQKPYGNQSSFLRHLVLLEKYFRGGDLILATNASHHSVNYSESVQNRLRAYDNIPKSSSMQVKRSSGILMAKDASIINAANIPKNTPITITQINNITPTIVNKTRVPPPGLISLHPGTIRPTTPASVKVPQTNKIKIPLTKNWRPTLIPIDPTLKSDKDKKPGYVKVVSNGKPYYITVDDYNRMCAIKKSYDLKQKRLLEASQKPKPKNLAILPKIPKSLTVIPQTIQQKSSPPLNSNLTSKS